MAGTPGYDRNGLLKCGGSKPVLAPVKKNKKGLGRKKAMSK